MTPPDSQIDFVQLARLVKQWGAELGFQQVGIADTELTEASPKGSGFLADVVEVWEYETRSAREAGVRTVMLRTGLVLDPYFSGSKYRWLLNNSAGVNRKLRAGRVAAGTVDSYLVWQLTGGHEEAMPEVAVGPSGVSIKGRF